MMRLLLIRLLVSLNASAYCLCDDCIEMSCRFVHTSRLASRFTFTLLLLLRPLLLPLPMPLPLPAPLLL
jgi:hypothetical protein